MSAPSSDSIIFSHDGDQQGLRLLELPPELLELINGPDAPRYDQLVLALLEY